MYRLAYIAPWIPGAIISYAIAGKTFLIGFTIFWVVGLYLIERAINNQPKGPYS